MHFIDLHCHFLPSVDDGPPNLEETVEMLRTAYAGGTRAMAATPHMFLDMFGNDDAPGMLAHFEDTVAGLEQLSNSPGLEFLGEMELFSGAENFVGPGLLAALEQRRVLTLAGSRYLLVEFPIVLDKPHFMPVLNRILARGYVPVLAHIERYRACQGDTGLIENFLEAGCLTQINASSLSGGFWARRRRMVWKWLKQDLVSVIASDGHGSDLRPPLLGEAYRSLKPHFPQDKIDSWLSSNPRWILSAPPADSTCIS